jgi:hypothetical protein
MADVAASTAGYLLARALPIWGAAAALLVLEALLALTIRDGLALNLLMLIHPLEAVRAWQMG